MTCEKCLFRNSPDVCDLLCPKLEEAGTLLGHPVFVDPTLKAGELVFGPYLFFDEDKLINGTSDSDVEPRGLLG